MTTGRASLEEGWRSQAPWPSSAQDRPLPTATAMLQSNLWCFLDGIEPL